MNNLGELTIALGLIAISVSSACYMILSSKKDNTAFRNAARFSFFGFAALVTLSSMLLMHFILNHQFIYSYVARYSSRVDITTFRTAAMADMDCRKAVHSSTQPCPGDRGGGL